MENSEGSVKCVEPPVFNIATVIEKNGYVIGDFCGYRLPRSDITNCTKHVSILKAIPVEQRGLFGRVHRSSRYEHIGRIDLTEKPLQFVVYGRNNVSELEALATKINGAVGLEVEMVLGEEHAREGSGSVCDRSY